MSDVVIRPNQKGPDAKTEPKPEKKPKAGGPKARILHDAVGNFLKGEVVPVSDFPPHTEFDRLVSLGAIEEYEEAY